MAGTEEFVQGGAVDFGVCGDGTGHGVDVNGRRCGLRIGNDHVGVMRAESVPVAGERRVAGPLPLPLPPVGRGSGDLALRGGGSGGP